MYNRQPGVDTQEGRKIVMDRITDIDTQVDTLVGMDGLKDTHGLRYGHSEILPDTAICLLGLQTDIPQQRWTDKQCQIDVKADRQKRASDTAMNTARCMVMSQIFLTSFTQCLFWARYMVITSFCPHNYSMR